MTLDEIAERHRMIDQIEALDRRVGNQVKLIAALSADRREKIATACLAGLLAQPIGVTEDGQGIQPNYDGKVDEDRELAAYHAVDIADRLIEALGKPAETTKQE